MTTRKLAVLWPQAVALAALLLMGGGCATPGPLHVYALPGAHAEGVSDLGPDTPPAEIPSYLAPGELVTGFAYDPFTDHFFLRLAPGNRIRVVDRPARAVKREFPAENTPDSGGGDLAVRPRDGHLFLCHPTDPTLIELNRFGKFVRTIALSGLNRAPSGVAYDMTRDRLLVLAFTPDASVKTFDLAGRALATAKLDRAVATGALGYDADRREIYTPLAGGAPLGVFDEQGHLQRTLPTVAAFLDLGPRSFLRMF
jgi:hypothetical protein